ncbi:predicted protein [Cyanophage PSS2]|uniref:hypothetical protein n=1 Tax=Cyanophage PSS2 TaxID=658401 RepID=UPI0001B04013|nr:hypothetical protein PSS2_gp061 [Cyanophage PSS2]ACT65623.1 hypothetical protein [Cyanophage PSS2]ACY75764.1 predicted protein [Cyanophage PSS2]
MPAARTGPTWGPLPDLDVDWTIYEADTVTIAYSPEQTRGLIMEIQGLASSYKTLHRISTVMGNVVAMPNPVAVERIKTNVAAWVVNQATITTEKTTLSTDDLPLIKADVIEYSEEPLKQGKNIKTYKLQPLFEEQARLAMRICLDLDLATAGVEGAPCCPGGNAMSVYGGQLTTVIRS